MSDREDDISSTARYFGKYAGIVVENGPPSQGAHRGELTVQVPGILEEKPGEDGTRPLQVVAAPSFLPGFFFIPEKGARVWVEFVAGDIDFPIWTGVWYPENAAPARANASGPNEHQKVIRTASGNVIEIDDTESQEKVRIQDKYGNVIELANQRISIAGKGKIEIDAPSVVINRRLVAPTRRPL